MSVRKISVVTVCLNARDTIRLTMESVRAQSFGNIEHVIIDGGSTDGTVDIVREYEPGYFVSEPDNGVYDAMDKGGRAASGDIVIFLNAGDTFFDEETCEAVAGFFDATGADIAFGNLMPVYLRPTDLHDHGAFSPGKLLDLGYVRNRRQLYDESIHHQATFYRRWIFDRCEYRCSEPNATGEYHLLLCAVMKEGATVKHIPRPVTRFVLGGISTRDFSKEWEKYTAARETLRRMYFPAGPSTHLADADEFVDPRFAASSPAASPGATIRRRQKLKEWIKSTPFFRAYDRIALGLSSRVANLVEERMEATAERQAQRIYNDIRYMVEANLLSQLTEVVNQNKATSAALAERLDRLVGRTEGLVPALSRIQHAVHEVARSGLVAERGLHETLLALDRLDRRLDTVLINQANLRFGDDDRTDEFGKNGFRVFSQWDEDGLIHYLVSRIPRVERRFVEFGVGDYSEANTRLLLERDNWVGLVIECDSEAVERIRAGDFSWRHSLTTVEAFVDRDNINDLLTKTGFTGEIGLLSIDVDGVDYWIWEAISVVSPQIVICEYNGAFGSQARVTVPYKPDFDRTREHSSMVYAGASLGALEHLGRAKGYTLIGTSCGGNNAFFLRDDVLAQSGVQPAAKPYTRPRFREARNPDGTLAFMDIADALRLVDDRIVIDVETGQEIAIGSIPISYD